MTMEVLESILIIHRLLQATSLTQLHYQKGAKLKGSKVLLWYSIVVVLISIAMLLYGIFDKNLYLNETNSDVGNTVDYIQLAGVKIGHIVAVIESIFRRQMERVLLQKIQEIDDIFERSLNENLQKKVFRSKMIWRFLGMCCLYFGSEIFVLGVLFISADFINFRYWISYFLPLVITGLRYYQVFVVVYMIKERFDKINQCLTTLKLSRKNTIVGGGRKFPNTLGPAAEIFETEQRLSRLGTSAMAYNKLIIIRDIYNRLWELTILINKCYGISMLINIGNDFVSITSNCYWMFLRFKQSPNTFLELIKTVGSAVWSIPHFFNVLIITAICHWTVESAKKTAVMVHKIEMDAKNDNHNIFIEQFSLQMLHQKIAFTAFGFFNIDFTLLYTIAGATTTYLIILIQFHMNEQKNVPIVIKSSPSD